MSQCDTDLILGLDISTAVTGIAVLRPDGSLLELDFVDTRKIDGLWNTADAIRHRISKLNLNRTYAHLFIEEDLRAFRRGLSSAATISTLAKINGIVSYMSRTALNVEPIPISATRARNECGVKIIKAVTAEEKKDNLWVKKQVFDHMYTTQSDISSRTWPVTRPTKKNPIGRLRDECFDMIDAYTVARCGWARLHTTQTLTV